MRKFVVGHVDFFDNDLRLELIEAETENEARWKHSQLQSEDWENCDGITEGMNQKEFHQWCFDFDMLVSCLEISLNHDETLLSRKPQ